MPIQWHPRFHPKCVSRSKSNRSNGTLSAFHILQEHAHRRARHRRSQNHFDTIFAGISSSTHNQFHDDQTFLDESISLQRWNFARQCANNFHRFRPLQSDHRCRFSLILELEIHVAFHSGKVCQQLQTIRCVAHHQIL